MKKNGAEATYAYNPLPTTAGCTDIVAHFKGHTHVWTYEYNESHDTLTAICTGTGTCDITDAPAISITAPSKKIENDNGSPEAILTVSENWTTDIGLFAAPTEIMYVKKSAPGIVLPAAPETAGDFVAGTVAYDGDHIYSVGVFYSIAPATPIQKTTFVEVTDESQLTEDNIKSCSEAQAKAWIIEHYDEIKAKIPAESYVDFFWKEFGLLWCIDIEDTDFTEDDINEAVPWVADIDEDALEYFEDGELIYICGENATPTPIPTPDRVKPIPSSGSGISSSGGSSSSSSSTSSSDVSGNSQSSQKMWAQLNDDHTVTVGWDKISGASKYVLMVEKDGKDIELVTTSKNKVTIKMTAPNNVTFKYKLKVKQGGVLSDAPTGYTTSLKVYYKPVVKLTNKDGKVTASWKKVPNATGYRIYKLVNGKMRLVTETESSAVRFKAASGKKYTFAVSACVNGEWTKLYKSDRVSITAK